MAIAVGDGVGLAGVAVKDGLLPGSGEPPVAVAAGFDVDDDDDEPPPPSEQPLAAASVTSAAVHTAAKWIRLITAPQHG
jgi:hypothetical protein